MAMSNSTMYRIMVFVAVLWKCGTNGGRVRRTYGGALSNLQDFPYIVLVNHRCTGSLIDTNLVLTAAHCFKGDRLRTATVQYMNRSLHINTIVSNRVIINEGFQENLRFSIHDIALIQLKESIINKKATLRTTHQSWPSSAGQSAQNCSVLGFGNNKYNRVALLKSTLTARHGPKACKCLPHEYDDRYLVCTEGVNGDGICPGDSGGPMVCSGGTVVAVVSAVINVNLKNCQAPSRTNQAPIFHTYVAPCAHQHQLHLYTYIYPYLHWIRLHSAPHTPHFNNE